MRILIPTTEFPPHPGGVSTVAFEEACGLALLGEGVTVEAIQPGNDSPCGGAVVRRRTIRAGAIARLVPLAMLVWRAARDVHPDFIWTPTYRGFGLPVMLVAAARGIPYGIYIHGTEIGTESRSAARRAVMRRVLSGASFVGTNSDNTRRLLLQYYPGIAPPVVPIHPGVHADRFLDPAAVKAGHRLRAEWLGRLPDAAAIRRGGAEPVMLFSAARIARLKGTDFVLRALAANVRAEAGFPAVYVAAGDGPDLDAFRGLATELGVSGRVLFSGPIPYESISAAYLAADIYAQPSQPVGDFLESFGISFVEAQAAGLPCIGSDWGGVPEAVARDETALLVPVGDHDAVAAAVRTLVKNPGRRTAMASAGRLHAARYSWRSHAERLLAEIQHRLT